MRIFNGLFLLVLLVFGNVGTAVSTPSNLSNGAAAESSPFEKQEIESDKKFGELVGKWKPDLDKTLEYGKSRDFDEDQLELLKEMASDYDGINLIEINNKRIIKWHGMDPDGGIAEGCFKVVSRKTNDDMLLEFKLEYFFDAKPNDKSLDSKDSDGVLRIVVLEKDQIWGREIQGEKEGLPILFTRRK